MPVCVVAGVGEKGIGEHVAKRFASEGYAIAMLARRKENLDALEKEIAGSKGYVCDVSIPDQVHSTVQAITADMGPIDVLIVNTSGGAFKPFDETTQDDFDLSMRTGPSALFAFAKAVTPGMIERGHGVIGVTGATASWRGMPSTSAKAAGNFAMRALAQSLARDMAPKGIHVFHVIIDGIVDQPRTHAWMPNKPDEEFMKPADIAETYWQLAKQPRSCWGFEMNLMAGPCFGTMASI
jgi:NAD(P)-dependent dehydrogenase (short-subunit alcohol dehydrogenase family)